MRKTKEEYEGIVNTEPVKVQHICWFTCRDNLDSTKICLKEVVRAIYTHPCAPDDAHYYQEELRLIKTIHQYSEEAGALLLMEANQDAISHQMRDSELWINQEKARWT